MSLTGKLILGFLFALVLQVAQMLISGYFTAQVQLASVTVADALRANIAVQRSRDVVRELQVRIAADAAVEPAPAPKLMVYQVYLDEQKLQSEVLTEVLGMASPEHALQIDKAAAAVHKQMVELRQAAQGADPEVVGDALAFLDDALGDSLEALEQAQVRLGQIGERGVEREREVHDLPLQAGLAITIAGVVIMAVFVGWFSRQLVIPIEKAWAELETRVEQRTAELASTVGALESEIVERKRAESEREELHTRFVETSRQAGMAELANGVPGPPR